MQLHPTEPECAGISCGWNNAAARADLHPFMVRRSHISRVGTVVAWVGGLAIGNVILPLPLAFVALTSLLHVDVSDELYRGIVIWSLVVGGILLVTGILIVEFEKRYVRARGLTESELRSASRKRLREMAMIAAGIVAVNLFLWLPVIGMVKPGDGIRPMVQAPASIVMSAGMVVVGFVAVCEHLFLLRPRWHALVSLLLAAIAIGSYVAIECYLSSIGVWYKP